MNRIAWIPGGLVLAVLCAFLGAGGRDFPVTEPAASIHPQQEALAMAALLERADKGSRVLMVEDGSQIDPRQWVLIKSKDGLRQDVHCLKSVALTTLPDGSHRYAVRLTGGLRYPFQEGSLLIQGSVPRERGIVGLLKKKGKAGQDAISVETTGEIDGLEQIVLQSEDGRLREAHCLLSIKPQQVILLDRLRNTFDKGSSIVQGRLADEILQPEAHACCCSGKAAGR